MPTTKRKDELEDTYFRDDDSSDEEEDESNDDSDDEESGSGSDSDDSDSESGSDSDDSDSDSDDESSSGSDSDGSSLKKKKKDKNDEKKDEEDEPQMSTLYKIRQISSKLSWLLDDLHKTFKPKSVPKIDPKDVFPYPYTAIPQFSPTKHYQHNVIIESNNKLKSPISSPIRHGNAIDRGTGGNYIFPAYALPPSKNEIKKLYRNYSDVEMQKIAENQKKERDSYRKFLFSRKSKSDSNLWENDNFSDEFISASNNKRNSNNSRFKSMFGLNKRDNEIDNKSMPHTFDELYKHYDQQKRLIEQKQARMNGMKNRLYWFRKNNNVSNNVNERISEKKPLMNRNENENEDKNKQLYNPKKSLKETETNLLNKAAQILLGNGNDKPSTSQYDTVDTMCPDSPDSLQQKILHIASDDENNENRMPKFV